MLFSKAIQNFFNVRSCAVSFRTLIEKNFHPSGGFFFPRHIYTKAHRRRNSGITKDDGIFTGEDDLAACRSALFHDPKRRLRSSNSRIAASKSSVPISGNNFLLKIHSAYADCHRKKLLVRYSPDERRMMSMSCNSG